MPFVEKCLASKHRHITPKQEDVIKRSFQREEKTRINHKIKAREVRLIADDGKQLGVVPLSKALEEAEKRELDLVEVAPKAKPPVCRILDYGKYRYEQTKREKEARHHSHKIKLKEIKFRPNIGKHDYEYKKKHVIEFLEHGDKVKVTCYYRGREMAHQEIGRELVNRLVSEVDEYGAVESQPKKMGNMYSVVLGPVKTNKK